MRTYVDSIPVFAIWGERRANIRIAVANAFQLGKVNWESGDFAFRHYRVQEQGIDALTAIGRFFNFGSNRIRGRRCKLAIGIPVSE